MARYRVIKRHGKFLIQSRFLFIWFTISNEYATSNDAIKIAQLFIDGQKDEGKVVWESKE